MSNVTFVRIYLTEGEHMLDKLIKALHDQEHVRGVTVFRAISGFGPSGKMHESSLVDVSLDLPLVVEFFDTPGRAEEIIQHIKDIIDPRHIVSWLAHTED
ncbi:MAG: hypothetical protein BMS9Abin15_1127 [Gammaproteobacteria bacterium]|nr:MAG: hypothetical protein BMS9Abin15_1127 [Gammaproteobacteria bacterium]